MPCEDYPCCGHAPGDCPSDYAQFDLPDADEYLPYPCLECGARIPKKGPDATNSSYCAKCLSNWDSEEMEYRRERQEEYDAMYGR